MKKTATSAIQLTGISKKYEIHHEKPTLVEKFVHGRNETYWALRDITLDIKTGEKVGIIGPNGSGKTTLLKIVTGITAPTTGTVKTHGNVVSLIDIQAGFHPDLTGYQNIFINGMLLGLRRDDIRRNLSSIISFADIRQFIDTPLYTYSSGMILRLGFAIAIHANPTTIIMDENITVGDNKYREKIWRWINRFIRKNHTLVMASHEMNIIRAICTRTIQLERGRIVRQK